MADAAQPAWRRALERGRRRWRAWLRAFHRDIGYLLVGLTVIYAVSGLAINHVGDWDPNFRVDTTVTALAAPLAADDAAAAEQVLDQLGIEAEARDFFREGDRLEIFFDNQTIVADAAAKEITQTAEKPRWFLRVANWLHYNRGKEAWTYVADSYAALLLFLAFSGVFLNKGKKGLVGRGAFFIAVGAAIPLLYVQLSGGP